jgi:hypothetical protein
VLVGQSCKGNLRLVQPWRRCGGSLYVASDGNDANLVTILLMK